MTRLIRCRFLFFVTAGILIGSVSSGQSPGVYRSRVEPHWFADSTKFWYRNDLRNSRREFILVDAQKGTRTQAFDHKKAAAAISDRMGKTVAYDQLPATSIVFSDDMAFVTLIGKGGGHWRIDLASYEIMDTRSGRPDVRDTDFFMPPRRSVDRGGDIEFTIKNEFRSDVQLIWIDRSGERQSYGRVTSGQVRTQHTFAGHVWLLLSNDGKSLAAFEAVDGMNEVVVNEGIRKVVAEQQQKARSANSRGRKRNKEPASSTDTRMQAYVKDHNLWIKPTGGSESDESVALSDDATKQVTFRKDASRARLIHMQYNLKDPDENVPNVQWSPDSQYLLAFQTKTVSEPRVHYVESSPKKSLQPLLQSYPYAKPGDPIPISRPRLFDISDASEIDISQELFPNPYELRFLKWSDDSSRFWLRYNERGHQVMRLLEVRVVDGNVRTVVEERSDTFIHYSGGGKNVLEWLPDAQLLWASERSGWNHLYRYDTATGKVVNAVTTGEWNVRRIHRIDREAQQIWFYAVGIMSGQDPYHEHFCRVNFDGSEMMVLTEGDGTHEVTFSPDEQFFLDRYSRVDLAPVTELRRSNDGQLVALLEEADASEVIAARGSLPKRFHAKGRDGVTDIWGIIHLPRHFDDQQKYPVVENIYAGPHDHHVPKTFRSRYRHQQQIADRGTIVVQIDGMGTAWRSKKFHDVCFKNLRDGGFPDRIAWMKAAAAQFPWMDISRVGIYGGSAGGQNAMAAVLWHGTFYKAAVADCGCHDNRMDKLWWNEQWMGLPGDGSYITSSNMENAYRLQGKLMLVVGELDRNVDPASTTQVVRKLIEADKDFEFLLIPGAGHGACERPYGSRRRADFLAKHLNAVGSVSPELAP